MYNWYCVIASDSSLIVCQTHIGSALLQTVRGKCVEILSPYWTSCIKYPTGWQKAWGCYLFVKDDTHLK
jgi:hypothetical protein